MAVTVIQKGTYRLLVCLLLILAAGRINTSPAYAATFIVNDLGDADDADLGDGVCDTDLGTPGLQCTLRAAVRQANAAPDADTINFAVSGIIAIGSNLATLSSGNVTIQGTFLPGPPAAPAIILQPAFASTATVGFDIRSENNTISSLAMVGFSDAAVRIRAANNVIAGSFIGTADGINAVPNGTGVSLSADANNNRIGGTVAGEGNVIAGNANIGIQFQGAAACSIPISQNQVQGNYIGIRADGTAALPNGDGIVIGRCAVNNTIGGSTPEARNVISGNIRAGVVVSGAEALSVGPDIFATANRIQGNYIGIDPTGNLTLGNGTNGIEFTAGARGVVVESNVISGSGGAGIFATSSSNTRSFIIRANLIGTNAAATAGLPNGGDGILFDASGPTDVLVENNLIAANIGNGVSLLGGGARGYFQGNFIGTNASGTLPGNGGHGILLGDASQGSLIGLRDGGGGAGNMIALNGGDGVRVAANPNAPNSFGNSIRGNIIFGNAGLGIDLGGDGATLNDAGDTDAGPNGLLNYPVLSNIGSNGTQIVLDIALQVEPLPVGFENEYRTHEIHFFANAACDPSGFGEGQRYLGFLAVDVSAAGNYTANNVLLPYAVAPTEQITATTSRRRYDPVNPVPPPANPPFDARQYETSEFSPCVPLDNTADVSISKTSSPAAPGTGSTFVYILSVTNSGPSDAHNVQVVDTLPTQLTFVSASPGCTHSLSTITCAISTLPAGGSTTLLITVAAPNSTVTIINSANVSADEPDFQPNNNTATHRLDFVLPTSTPTLSPTPTGSRTPMLTVTPSPTLTLVVVPPTATDLPIMISATPGSLPSSTPVSSARKPTRIALVPTSTAFLPTTTPVLPTDTPLPTATPVPPSNTPLPTATPIPPTDTPLPTATPVPPSNTPLPTATPIPPTITATALAPGSLEIQKSMDVPGSSSDSAIVDVTVNNTGQQAVTNVVLIEELLAGMTIVESRTQNPTCTKSATSITCSLGTLLSGTSARVSFVVQSQGINPLLGRTIVRSDTLPDVELKDPYLVKWVSPPFALPGEEVTWTVVVVNPANTAARNVVVRDTIPAPLTALDADATAGRVSIDGNDVVLRLTELGAVQSVTLTVRTRVERSADSAPVINNNACITTAQQPQARCIQAPLFRVSQLPQTGEPPWWRVWVVSLAGMGLGSVLLSLRWLRAWLSAD